MRKKMEKLTGRSSTTTTSLVTMKDLMIHEHDFRPTNLIRTTTYCGIRCITCDKCFCDLCGKALKSLKEAKLHRRGWFTNSDE
jgi:hypothetical protein